MPKYCEKCILLLFTDDPVDVEYSSSLRKRPTMQEHSISKDSNIKDDIKLSKVFKDDKLHVSVSLAPIDVKDNKISFSYETNEGKILELAEDERLVSEIILVPQNLPPVLNVPALLSILCSVEMSDLDMDTDIVIKYFHAGRSQWEIQENIGLEEQEYGNLSSYFFEKS